MVERYSGRGHLTASPDLDDQPIDYRIDVWEQFLGGRGGRYKVEGTVTLETAPEGETFATLVLEDRIRLRTRVFTDGRVLGDSAPVFPKS